MASLITRSYQFIRDGERPFVTAAVGVFLVMVIQHTIVPDLRAVGEALVNPDPITVIFRWALSFYTWEALRDITTAFKLSTLIVVFRYFMGGLCPDTSLGFLE